MKPTEAIAVLEKLTPFQRMLLAEMKPGVWYDVFQEQGTDGAQLPDWFYRNQSQPNQTMRSMIAAGAIERRTVAFGLQQVRAAAVLAAQKESEQ